MTRNFWSTKAKIITAMLISLTITYSIAHTPTNIELPKLQLDIFNQKKTTNIPTQIPVIDNPITIPSTIIIPTTLSQPTVSVPTGTNLNFQPIASGISTAVNQGGQKYIKIEAGTVVEVTEYTLVDGRRIRVIKPIN